MVFPSSYRLCALLCLLLGLLLEVLREADVRADGVLVLGLSWVPAAGVALVARGVLFFRWVAEKLKARAANGARNASVRKQE